MREMEFLPAWYAQLRRRKRMVMLQLWATLLVAGGFGFWLVLARAECRAQGDRTHDRRPEARSKPIGSQGTEHPAQGKGTSSGRAANRREGRPARRGVAAARQARRDHAARDDGDRSKLRHDRDDQGVGSRRIPVAAPDVDRKLLVKVSGITPSDADWASVLAKLSTVPFFQDVRPGRRP